jgi:putative transcriptional regulator
MKIIHHPAPESLMSCSAGSMPEAFAAVMASHIAMCPSCRRELTLLQEVGVALFDIIAPIPVARDAPVLAMRGLESECDVADRRPAEGDIPVPLVSALGPSLDMVAWARVSPGVWQHQIALSNDERGTLKLIKVAPGRSLPAHDHDGSELTLVLRGSFRDESGQYCVGDVADVSTGMEHAPVGDPEEGCICLVATHGKLQFKSRIARLVQPLTSF